MESINQIVAVIGKLLFDSTLLGIIKCSGGLFVGLLLETAPVLLDVTCGCMYEVRVEKREHRDMYHRFPVDDRQ